MSLTPHGQINVPSDSDVFHFNAEFSHRIDLPSGYDFISDARILRDGQDLILRAPDGSEVVVDGYFAIENPPLLVSGDGAALTPALVDSFAAPAHGVQYAKNGSSDGESPVGVVKEASGEASVTHPDGRVETVTVGTQIYQGDIVETKGDGAVSITFTDETTFAVSENARLAIDEYVFDPSTQSGETGFSVLRGVFVFTSGLIGREDPDDVQINTPVGSIGIRGTTIMGTIQPGGDSQITVVEGAIVVRNGDGEQTLSQQFETVQLGGFEDPMTYRGVVDSTQISNDYNVLRSVSAPLFSTIDSVAPESSGEEPAPSDPDEAPPAADQQPVNKTDAAPSDEQPVTVVADASPVSFNENFDTGAGLADDSTGTPLLQSTLIGDQPIVPAGVLPPPPPPPLGVQGLPPPSFTPPPPPPPAGGTGTVSPLVRDLNLADVISAGTGGTFIASIAGASEHGFGIAPVGDLTHNGSMDFAFLNNLGNNGNLVINANVINAESQYGFSTTEKMSVAGAGDFNRDGFLDIVLGSQFSDDGATLGSGDAVIINGNNPLQTISLGGFSGGDGAGASVSGIGDFNGDGYSDIVIGTDNGGVGQIFALYGNNTAFGSTIDVSSYLPSFNTLDPDGFKLQGGAGDFFGETVSGIGDFNSDGFSDLAISNPGAGSVQIQFGKTGVSGSVGAPLTITGLNIDATDNTVPIVNMGDINGDGISDMMIGETGPGIAHLFYGGAGRTTGSVSVTSSDLKIVSAAGTEIIGMGRAGDFNGDGRDDIAVAMRTGDMLDIYVIYGKPGLTGTINPEALLPRDGFWIEAKLGGPLFNLANPATDKIDITLTTGGDLNNDGFDDLMIGLPNLDSNGGAHSNDGGIAIVNGRAEAADISSGLINFGNIANRNGQSLIGTSGNDTMTSFDGTTVYGGVAYHGGAGHDIFQVYGTNYRELDGGTQFDTVEFMTGGIVDLRAMDANLSRIEVFKIDVASTVVKIGLDDIFSLLQQSSNNTLKFDTVVAGVQLQVDNNGTSATSLSSAGFTNNGNVGGYTDYQFGAYHLYVDQDIATTSVSNLA